MAFCHVPSQPRLITRSRDGNFHTLEGQETGREILGTDGCPVPSSRQPVCVPPHHGRDGTSSQFRVAMKHKKKHSQAVVYSIRQQQLFQLIIAMVPARPATSRGEGNSRPAPSRPEVPWSDAAIAPPTQSSPHNCHKEMAIQRMLACFRLCKAPHMGDIGENDPQAWRFPSRSVCSAVAFRFTCRFCRLKPAMFLMEAIAAYVRDKTLATIIVPVHPITNKVLVRLRVSGTIESEKWSFN